MSTIPCDKLGRMTKLGARVKNWRDRFFILQCNRHTLLYFRTEAECMEYLSTGMKTYAGSINVADATIYVATYIQGKPFALEIGTPKRIYFTICSDDDDLCDWIDMLCRAGARLKAPSVGLNNITGILSKHGWMHKRGYWNKAFRLRFFRVLEQGGTKSLVYYKTWHDTHPRGSIPLSGCHLDHDYDSGSALNFCLSAGKRTYVFRVSDKIELQEWRRVLSDGNVGGPRTSRSSVNLSQSRSDLDLYTAPIGHADTTPRQKRRSISDNEGKKVKKRVELHLSPGLHPMPPPHNGIVSDSDTDDDKDIHSPGMSPTMSPTGSPAVSPQLISRPLNPVTPMQLSTSTLSPQQTVPTTPPLTSTTSTTSATRTSTSTSTTQPISSPITRTSTTSTITSPTSRPSHAEEMKKHMDIHEAAKDQRRAQRQAQKEVVGMSGFPSTHLSNLLTMSAINAALTAEQMLKLAAEHKETMRQEMESPLSQSPPTHTTRLHSQSTTPLFHPVSRSRIATVPTGRVVPLPSTLTSTATTTSSSTTTQATIPHIPIPITVDSSMPQPSPKSYLSFAPSSIHSPSASPDLSPREIYEISPSPSPHHTKHSSLSFSTSIITPRPYAYTYTTTHVTPVSTGRVALPTTTPTLISMSSIEPGLSTSHHTSSPLSTSPHHTSSQLSTSSQPILREGELSIPITSPAPSYLAITTHDIPHDTWGSPLVDAPIHEGIQVSSSPTLQSHVSTPNETFMIESIEGTSCAADVAISAASVTSVADVVEGHVTINTSDMIISSSSNINVGTDIHATPVTSSLASSVVSSTSTSPSTTSASTLTLSSTSSSTSTSTLSTTTSTSTATSTAAAIVASTTSVTATSTSTSTYTSALTSTGTSTSTSTSSRESLLLAREQELAAREQRLLEMEQKLQQQMAQLEKFTSIQNMNGTSMITAVVAPVIPTTPTVTAVAAPVTPKAMGTDGITPTTPITTPVAATPVTPKTIAASAPVTPTTTAPTSTAPITPTSSAPSSPRQLLQMSFINGKVTLTPVSTATTAIYTPSTPLSIGIPHSPTSTSSSTLHPLTTTFSSSLLTTEIRTCVEVLMKGMKMIKVPRYGAPRTTTIYITRSKNPNFSTSHEHITTSPTSNGARHGHYKNDDHVIYCPEFYCISWDSGKKSGKSEMVLDQHCRCIEGQGQGNFLQTKVKKVPTLLSRAHLSFSITSPERTLDLIAENETEYKQWIHVIKAIISSMQHKQ